MMPDTYTLIAICLSVIILATMIAKDLGGPDGPA
jgi:hypothetical protein